MPLKIVRDNAENILADAVVISAEQKKIGNVAAGEVVMTPAVNLCADFVIQTVAPTWSDGKHGEREILADCYENSLKLADERGCKSIAFPLISAGISGFPSEIALAVAIRVIRNFLRDNETEIFLAVPDKKFFRISDELFDDLKKFLDEKYDEEIFCSTDFAKYPAEKSVSGASFRFSAPAGKKRFKDKKFRNDSEKFFGKAPSLEELLNNTEETFSVNLLRLIDEKGKTDPEVYKRANIDRKHFSKIRNNPSYRPGKNTALAFAVALELNLDETRDFIGRAGYALSRSNKADIIVEYFIGRGEYDIFKINETLFAFEQPLLGC